MRTTLIAGVRARSARRGRTSSTGRARFACSRRGTLEGVRNDRLCGAVAPYVAAATLPRMSTGVARAAWRAITVDCFEECVGLTSPSDEETGDDGEHDKDTANIIFTTRSATGCQCFDKPPLISLVPSQQKGTAQDERARATFHDI